jgi:hypothetical protein
MPEKVIQTDFSGGILSEKFAGRFDLGAWKKCVSILTNWVPTPQGGITYRPGTSYILASAAKARLVPYQCSPTTNFLLEISASSMRVIQNGAVVSTIATPWATWADISELQYALLGGSMFFCHRNHAPRKLTWSGGTTFAFGTLTITGNTTDIDGNPKVLPFQSSGNYPGSVSAVAGRAVFAGSINQPQAIWLSEPYEYEAFHYFETVTVTYTQVKDSAEWADPHVPESEEVNTSRNVVTDASAIEVELASDENEYILGMVSSRDLVVLTSSSEWIIPESITGTSPSATLQSRNGSVRLQPLMVGGQCYFASSPKSILAYAFSSDSEAWGSQDISFNSELLAPGVVDMDFAQHPSQTLYCVLADGTVAVMEINPALQSSGWWLFSSPGGLVESLAVLPGTDGDDDVYFSILRGSVRSIEKLDRLWTAKHLDNAVTVTATAGAASGLAHLNGRNVYAVNGSTVLGTAVVSGGAITLAGLVAGTSYRIGILQSATMRLLRVLNTAADGQIGMMEDKRVARVLARVYKTLALKVGRTDAAVYPLAITTELTGDIASPFNGDWDTDGWVYIIQDQPLPATLLAIMVEVQ